MAPTFERSDSFRRDYKGLNHSEVKLVRESLEDFIEDLRGIEEGTTQGFRPGLRVKPMKGNPSIYEMTWDGNDGRATFQYGDSVLEGKRHVIWRRIGDHRIFNSP